MFSIKTYLTIIVLISSVGKAVQEDIFCDKTNSLFIDSVLTEFTKKKLKLSLFIGEDIYELEPIDNNFESVKVIKRSNLRSLNETLEPSVDTAFFTTSYQTKFQLWNRKKGLYFQFFRNRTIDLKFRPNLKQEKYKREIFESIVLTEDMDGQQFGQRLLFHSQNKERNQIGIKLFSFPSPTFVTHEYWLMTKDVGSVQKIKIINETDPEAYDLKNKVFYQLNDQNITAAFVYQNYWHIFSGRQFCKMKISADGWLDFCQIKDISDFFIDCQKNTEPTKSIANWLSTQISTKVDNSQTIVILVSIFIGIVLIFGWGITGLVIFIAYKYTQDQRTNQFESGQTTVSDDSMSRVSSVQTLDSGHTNKLKV